MTDEVTAKNETYKVFLLALRAESPAILGYVPEVYWENLKSPTIPDPTKLHFRTQWAIINTTQAAFSSCNANLQGKVYDTQGLVSFDAYAPMSVGNSDDLMHKLCQKIRGAFRGISTPGKVWYRDARIQRITPEDLFWRKSVVVETYFSEVA